MKVAILTQPLGHNYGGLLQAYALQRFLTDQGFEVTTIDRRVKPALSAFLQARGRHVAELAMGRIHTIPTKRKTARMLTELVRFKEQHLVMSPQIESDRALKTYCREQEFSTFIVGSDQVWRPRYSPNLYNFFLDFLDDSVPQAQGVAYAASFGVDHWELSADQTERCRELAERFSALSVREQSGIELCRNYLDRDALQMPDPTLLLDTSHYVSLIDETAPASAEEGANILTYLLDSPARKAAIVERIENFLNASSFSIKPAKGLAQVKRGQFADCVYPSVSLWLQSFREARFVLTDSFHGVLFSIIFNKPFFAVGNHKRGLSRFYSLLSIFGLEHRLIESAAEITPELMNNPIDWANVNQIREQQQAAGVHFLIKNIGAS